MDLNKYTQKSQEAILNAQQIAQDYGHPAIEPAHLLLAFMRQDEGLSPPLSPRWREASRRCAMRSATT